MTLERIVGDMATRMPWDVGQAVFAIANLKKGHGWDRTVQRYKGVQGTEEQSAQMAELLRQHLLCGEKLSRFYEVSPADLTKLRKAVEGLTVGKSDFADAYPLLLTDAQIAASFPQPHKLIAIEKNDDGLAIVFGSSRAILLRETLDKSDLPEEALDALSGYDQLVGVKLAKLQAIDIVWIPHTGTTVDVRVDYPKGMHQDVAGVAHERVRELLAQLVGFDALSTPVNLFPLINQLYQKSNEGTVVELAFGTTTASLKHEKMRRSGDCLRDEKYHLGGKAALASPIEPYRLSVQWDVAVGTDVTSRPELSLHGSSRVAMGSVPTLMDAVFRRCVGLADYEFVRSRLESLLSSEQAKAA